MPSRRVNPNVIIILRLAFWAFLLSVANIAESQSPSEELHAEKPESLILTVVFSNDIHGGIDRTAARFMNDEFPPPLGGGASAAQVIFNLRAQAHESGQGFLLLDAGDIFSGTLIGSQTGGKAVVEYMNAVGYDAMAIGNHEFDQGIENLKSLIAQAQFPVLSANIYVNEAEKWRHFVRPYVIKEVAGLKIAIVGLTTHGTLRAAMPEHVSDLAFADEVAAARQAISDARAEGAQFAIGLVHMGLPYSWEEGYQRLLAREAKGFPGEVSNAMELARRVPEFDALFCGDIHVGYREPWVDPVTHVPCFQTYGRGTGLGLVNLRIDLKSRRLMGWESFAEDGALITLFQEEFIPDSRVDSLIQVKAEALAQVYQEVIGYTPVTISRSGDAESPLGNLVTDSWRDVLQADLALTNTGGLRDDIPPGDITLQEIFNVLPFSNSLVLMLVRGDFFRDLLERKISSERIGFAISGARLAIDLSQTDGRQLQEITIGGQPLQPDRIYKLVTTEYLREGNSRFDSLAVIQDDQVSYSGALDREALAQYLSRMPTEQLAELIDGRIRVVGLP
jgi:2',3'-cyclic-nucleotide 2'-phosphodiesterase (5'-nucleotidase family)